MLNCKQVSLLVSQSIDRRLSWRERSGVRIHLLFCQMCARFKRQMEFLHAAMQQYTRREVVVVEQLQLSADARERIRRGLDRDRR